MKSLFNQIISRCISNKVLSAELQIALKKTEIIYDSNYIYIYVCVCVCVPPHIHLSLNEFTINLSQ